MADDLCHMSAGELARGIQSGDVSPVEVIESHLDRIEERNPVCNAYVTVLEEDARSAAREAERAIDSGEDLGPLHGVPVAIKDMWGYKQGVRHTFGSRLFEDFVPDESAVFVERLEEAGAIVLGKTNTPEFAVGPVTDNLVSGRTKNPFDLEKTAGGSSGGSASAVADGLTPLAQGSDMGGSIRIPAAFSGVYGLKPTFGRIPIVRQVRPDGFLHYSPYAHLGPLTRTVEDAALMLNIMAGPHPGDPHGLPDDGTDYLAATRRSIEGLTLAYSPDMGGFPIAGEIREVIEDAADAFADTGADVERIDLDLGLPREEILDLMYDWMVVTWQTYLENLSNRYGVDPFGENRDKLRPEFVETILESDEELTAADLMRRNVLRTEVFDALQGLFQEYDVLISPTTGVPPFDFDAPPTEVEGVEIEPLRGWVLTQPFNLTGQPVASIPAGFTDDGLPVGLQIVGEKFADDTVLAASAAFEEQRPWADEYPGR